MSLRAAAASLIRQVLRCSSNTSLCSGRCAQCAVLVMFRCSADVLDADAGASFIFVISQKSHQANTSYSDAKGKKCIFAHLLNPHCCKPFFVKASRNKNQVYSEDCGLHRTQIPLDPKKQRSIAVAPPVSSRKESPDVNNSLPIPTLPLWILCRDRRLGVGDACFFNDAMF